MEDLGYYYDEENELLVGLIPNIKDCKYFGYGKKISILTLHNVLCILNDHLPLHCGCTRYLKSNLIQLQKSHIYLTHLLKLMIWEGLLYLKKIIKWISRKMFLISLEQKQALLHVWMDLVNTLKCKWRKRLGYNKHAGTNARQIVPVTDF